VNPLTYDQVRELTGKIYPAVQKRELDRLGIPAKRRSDGSVLVLESAVNACFSDLADAKVSSSNEEPRWGALRDSDDGARKVKAPVQRTGNRGNRSVLRRGSVIPMQHAKACEEARDSSRDVPKG
jgi:hypothetical protein